MGDSSLSPSALSLLDDIVRSSGGEDEFSLRRALLYFLQRYGPMAESLVEIDARKTARELQQLLASGDEGRLTSKPEIITASVAMALERGREQASERDIGLVLLKASGYQAKKSAPAVVFEGGATKAGVLSSDSMLDVWGRDLTALASRGELPEMIGRESEVAQVTLVLCRETKANPVLTGPAGVGKTAVVEGLAARIAKGQVPPQLRGKRLVELRLTSMVAGTGLVGEIEKRVDQLVREASQPDVILFIDELHQALGAGAGSRGSSVSDLLKPALARGDIKLIGATTDEEYRNFIEQDSALERRFQPIPVEELGREASIEIAKARRDRLCANAGVEVPDAVVEWIVGFTDDFMRNRMNPDKAVDAIEQVVAAAQATDVAVVTLPFARQTILNMVGMYTDPVSRLDELAKRLRSLAILSEDDVAALIKRLRLSLAGNDINPVRPNAVILMSGRLAALADVLAAAISDGLFGTLDRVQRIGLSGLMDQDETAHTRFYGLPLGYVGAERSTGLIQRLNAQPWSVVVFEGIDRCGPGFRAAIEDALTSGYFTDARGKRQYLSDAVVILTAAQEEDHERPAAGFITTEEPPESVSRQAREKLRQVIGDGIMRASTVVVVGSLRAEHVRNYLESIFLPAVSDRYRQEGLEMSWDRSAVDLLQELGQDKTGYEEMTAVLDVCLSDALADLEWGSEMPRSIVFAEEGRLKLRPLVDNASEGVM